MVTRDETEAKLVFPSYRDVTVAWEPADSKHRGKLFLQHHLKGEPTYAEFRPPEGPEPEWVGKLTKVWEGLTHEYHSSVTFHEDNVQDWEDFWKLFPWGGLKDLPEEHLPAFTMPPFPTKPVPLETEEDHQLAMSVLGQAGVDGEGNRRAYFRDGKDMLKYPRATSHVTYGNFYLSGERYQAGTKGKRTFDAGKSRRRRRSAASGCHQPPPLPLRWSWWGPP